MKKNILKICFLVIFILMLVVPMLLTNFKPGVVSKLENRRLAEFPMLYDKGGNRTPRYFDAFENWYNDNVGLRKILFEANSVIQYDIFNSSAVDDIIVGKDGWLFYNDKDNIDIISNSYAKLQEEDLRAICDRQLAIRDKLAQDGREYVLVLPPAKISIYPEYVRGEFGVSRTPVDIVGDYLEENTDLKVVRLKDVMLEEKNNNPDVRLFFKTDTHWNARGGYVAYKTINSKFNEWGLVNKEPAQINCIDVDRMGDLLERLVPEDDKYYESEAASYEVINPRAHEVYQIMNPTPPTIEGDPEYDYLYQFTQNDEIRRLDYYENENKSLPKIACWADSMVMEWLTPLIAEEGSTFTGVWGFNMNKDTIDHLDPDIVILVLSERNIISTLRYVSESYVNGE